MEKLHHSNRWLICLEWVLNSTMHWLRLLLPIVVFAARCFLNIKERKGETRMKSIFERVLGSDYGKLHPQMRNRLDISVDRQSAVIGRGTMEFIWVSRPFLPVFRMLNRRHILLPQQGTSIPFTIENYAYVDSFGRETVTFARTFQFGEKKRQFNSTMIYSPAKKRIVDYLGSHQNLAVDLEMSVLPNGGIRFRSGAQRFYEGKMGIWLPRVLRGDAEVCEWYDEKYDRFHVEVQVKSPSMGKLLRYFGYFEIKSIHLKQEQIPSRVKPLREESRE